MNTESKERFLRPRETEAKVGLSRATIYRLVAAGTFPKPVRVSDSRIAWPESWLDKWMAERMAEVA